MELPGAVSEGKPAEKKQRVILKTAVAALKKPKHDRAIDLKDPRTDVVEAHVRATLEKFDKDRNGQFSYAEVREKRTRETRSVSFLSLPFLPFLSSPSFPFTGSKASCLPSLSVPFISFLSFLSFL